MSMIPREKYKPHGEDVCLHIYNHCTEGVLKDYPLGEDSEKRKMVSLLHYYLQKYNIKCLAYSIMSNHVHLCVVIKKDPLTCTQMSAAYKKFTRGKFDLAADDDHIKRLQKNSNNISEFMREFQRGFTIWYNKTREFKRRGTLWEARFKCTKLSGRGALINGLKYVELNPARAGMVQRLQDYEFTSYARWHNSGRHPFGGNMKRYFMPAVRECLDGNHMSDLKDYFDESYTSIIAHEGGATVQELDILMGRVKSNPHQAKSLLQKCRYWVDGVVISDKENYQHEMEALLGEERAKRRFRSKCFSGDDELYSLRHFTQ